MRRILTLCCLALLFIPVSGGCDQPVVSGQGEARIGIPFGKRYSYDDILVSRVVDGDTLKLENGERVRMIGVDTPEVHESAKLYRDSRKSGKDRQSIQRMGKKAAAFTDKLVEGKRVRLEFDKEPRDRYGRMLAYVYLKDGTFVNAEIIRQGFASPMVYKPNVKYAELFRSLYEEARRDRRGLWRETDPR